MIIDKLENFDKYLALHRNFSCVLSWFGKTDLNGLTAGRHEIMGDGAIYVNVQDDVALKPLAEANPEFHRRYIDIQLVLRGVEQMGWLPLPENIDEVAEFSEDKDVGFLKGTPLSWNTVPAGYFTVFFPWDVHAPCCGDGNVKKLVVKVRVD